MIKGLSNIFSFIYFYLFLFRKIIIFSNNIMEYFKIKNNCCICKKTDLYWEMNNCYDSNGNNNNMVCDKCHIKLRDETYIKQQQEEDKRKASNTLRLFGGMKRDLNMLCLVVAEIASKLNIEAKTYMGEDETRDYEWLDKQIEKNHNEI